MTELTNWNDTSIIFTQQWYWLAAAFVIGGWVGYTSNFWKSN